MTIMATTTTTAQKRIGVFNRLEIETVSTCNRTCETCLRNSIPDKQATSSWFVKSLLPFETIQRVMRQSREMGCREICLSHYCEPLMDERIVQIAQEARAVGFGRVFFCSNGDFLTGELASQLDGLVHDIGFSFYMNDPKRSERKAWVATLFKKTKLILGDGEHMVTHHSPRGELLQLVSAHRNRPCDKPMQRMIVNHKGEMLLCCDDLIGNFDLGSVHESSVSDLWFSEKHQRFVERLMQSGGRAVHQHCLSCPRG